VTNHTNFGSGEYKLKAMHDASYPGGVVVDPTPITSGEEITVLYDGLLDASGAAQMYLYVGYGDSRDWRNIQTHRMSKTGWGWVKTLEIPDDTRFNFCFHDGYGGWDNNNGINWSFEIHNGRRH